MMGYSMGLSLGGLILSMMVIKKDMTYWRHWGLLIVLLREEVIEMVLMLI